MNNFKKIGLTALAGSLAAVSANAIDLAVTGSTSVSYTSNSATKTSAVGGQALGVATGISFNGSGELENGWTVKSFAALDDGRANTLSSSQLTLGMGSLGTVVFAQQFGTAANGIDDVTPKVNEEAFDQAAGSVLQGFGRATAEGAITYKSPAFDYEGFGISVAIDYDPAANKASDDHDGTTSKAAGQGSGVAGVVKLTSDYGATFGSGVEQISGDAGYADKTNWTVYGLYSYGPVSVGYQTYMLDNGGTVKNVNDATETADYSGESYSVAFNVNDQLSIGYGVIKETKEAQSAVIEVDRDIKSLTAAYSTGGMTVSIQQTDTDNYKMAAAGSEIDAENTHITLAFAF
jgi:outer membrane protein OmpU